MIKYANAINIVSHKLFTEESIKYTKTSNSNEFKQSNKQTSNNKHFRYIIMIKQIAKIELPFIL